MTEQDNNVIPLGILACSDFFFVTRICDTARELGQVVRSCSNTKEIVELLESNSVPVLFIDLSSMSGCLDELAQYRQLAPQLKVIAFGSHVQIDLLKRAKQAGCDQVLPRSRFTKELVNLLQTHLGS